MSSIFRHFLTLIFFFYAYASVAQSDRDIEAEASLPTGMSSIGNVLLLGDYRDEIRALEGELLRVRPKKNTLTRLVGIARDDLKDVSEFEFEEINLDSALVDRFLESKPEKYTDLTEFSQLLESAENSIYIDDLNTTLEELERVNEGLFLEITQLLDGGGVDYRELEFLLGSRIGRGGCGYIARRLTEIGAVAAVPLSDCKADLVRHRVNADNGSQKDAKAALLTSAADILENALQSTSEREASIIENLNGLRERVREIRVAVSERQEAIEEQKREITPEMFQMITVTLLVFAVIMSAVMYSIIRLSTPSSEGEVIDKSITYPIFLELVTVFVLTVTILILGLANKMDNQALAALIGGISGYVLGRMNKTGQNGA